VYCLNTATIRGQKLGIGREVEIAAEAGYSAIEPWIESLRRWKEGGHPLADLRKKIEDLGLTVESGIGFAPFLVDNPEARAKALEQARQDMDLLAQIGARRIAAPPAGATQHAGLDLLQAAERYRALLELGDQMGVTPMLELWGFSKNLSRLGEAALVALETRHPKAGLLADVYHLHKGGSDFAGLRQLSAQAVQVFHMNDFPAEPPRAAIHDSHRVHCGDGVAPWKEILANLAVGGGRKVLSLELFNKTYYAQDALEVARTGLEKMKATVAQALA
jgi:sugar phosphate isomerase/epimerase